jgi:hypothetical protein
MRVFVTLFLMWLLAATLCGGRTSRPLACCAPFAILTCWVIWYQIQGWPLTSRPDLGLALFAGVTILGFLSGKLLRKVIFALPMLPAKGNKGAEDWDEVTFQFDIEAPRVGYALAAEQLARAAEQRRQSEPQLSRDPPLNPVRAGVGMDWPGPQGGGALRRSAAITRRGSRPLQTTGLANVPAA